MIFTLSSFGGIYDYNYSPLEQESNTTTERSPLMYGDFDKIIRFKALLFDEEGLTRESKTYLDTIVKTVDEYKIDKRKLGVSIIAYTQAVTDDKNEEAIASKTYANKIQNWFRKDLDKNTSEHISEEYAFDIQKLLIDKGIDKNMTVLEVRGANDPAYSGATSEGRALSNRVMVALYVYPPEDIEVDSDGDSVFDKKDACPETPIGVRVDLKGCPLDTDSDGVYDYKDQCPGTSKGIEVNNEEYAYPKVASFAQFLKENSQYKVEISGHTDSTGDENYNLTLSFLRANEVRKALIQEGIEARRLIVTGLGESMPVSDNEREEGRYANRRVEMKLYY
jgi:outer membrane protein OmpA-like peptidoglycan-associated protein